MFVTTSLLTLAILLGQRAEMVSAGMATRYQDCCVQEGSRPRIQGIDHFVDSCLADGVTKVATNLVQDGTSGCDANGQYYTCLSMQPYNDGVDKSLAYGFAAFTASNDKADFLCACYYAEFEDKDPTGHPLERTKLIFQATNIGG